VVQTPAPPTKCARGNVSGGQVCKTDATGGGLYCNMHTCTQQGCKSSKSNTVAMCDQHTGNASSGTGGGKKKVKVLGHGGGNQAESGV
jgi:hypothetical protein